MTKLTNKKYKVGVKEHSPKKTVIKVDKNFYKGMDTGRGFIALEKTDNNSWTFREKIVKKLKRTIKNVRFIK